MALDLAAKSMRRQRVSSSRTDAAKAMENPREKRLSRFHLWYPTLEFVRQFLLVRERRCRLPAQRSDVGGECLMALERLSLPLLADRLV